MKKIILLIILFVCSTACNQEGRKILTELPNELENIQESNDPTEGEIVAKSLSEMTPLSEEVLRNLIPKQMKDLLVDEKITVVGQQVMGSFGEKKFSISIVDVAGVNNQVAAQFIDSYTFDKTKETENFKTINEERDGIKTHAEYYRNNGKSEIYFLYNKRFYISFSNDDNQLKLNPDELWKAFDESALESLKNY